MIHYDDFKKVEIKIGGEIVSFARTFFQKKPWPHPASFFWGNGGGGAEFGLVRPQEGSGEECGRGSELTFFQNHRNSGQ